MSGAKLHVCHVVLSLNPGGLENGVINVINGLPRDSFRSSVICLQEAGAFAQRIQVPGVQVTAMGLKPGNDPWMPLRVARRLRTLKPDIVHTRNIEAFFYGAVAAKLARVPHLVHSEHGRTFPETALRSRLQRLLLKGTDYAFTVSRQLRSDMESHIGVRPGIFDVLYNGVDMRKFSGPASASPAQSQTVTILSIGRLAAVKNYALLLQALAQLPRDLVWRYQCVGEGPEREALQALAASLGLDDRVDFLGHREDVDVLLRGADIFVLPSLSEGMSNTLLEAMAAGVVAVASNVGGNAEIVAHGSTGLLFPSGDLRQLVAQLARLIDDRELRGRLGDAGRRHVEAVFDMSGMIQRYASMYQRVAG
jgi:sugar transferase (PEP-CTERM/EpsH1 system associated)